MNRGDWAKALLDALDIGASVGALVAIVAWEASENTAALNNPLATTEGGYGGTDLAGNSSGVKNYPTTQDGIDATVATLKNGLYGAILAALQGAQNTTIPSSTSAAQIASAIAASPWGTGRLVMDVLPSVQAHYGEYASVPVPGSDVTVSTPVSAPTSAPTIVFTSAINEPVAEPYPTATYSPRHPIVVAGDEVVGITAAPTPGGAWALTRLGQVLCYAGANYWGEPGEIDGGWRDIVSTGNGYLCVDATGKVIAFGVAVQNAPKT